MEGKLSAGESIDLDLYGRLLGHLRRVLESLGIERKPKDTRKAFDDFIAALPASAKPQPRPIGCMRMSAPLPFMRSKATSNLPKRSIFSE